MTYEYVDRTKIDYYTKTKSDSMINVVAGAKQLSCEEGEPKMVFEIELVEKQESMMAFKSLGFTSAIKGFYNNLNQWGVGKAPQSIVSIDNLHYSNELAIKDEEVLQLSVAKLSKSLSDVREILSTSSAVSIKTYKLMQKELQEYCLIELLSYTLELIYYKQMPEEYREKPFKPDRLRANLGLEQNLEGDQHICYQIAREKLDALNQEILETIYLLVRNNDENCERLTQFSDILKLQLLRSEKSFVSRLICHMYKMATFIFNDRSSVLLSENGIN